MAVNSTNSDWLRAEYERSKRRLIEQQFLDGQNIQKLQLTNQTQTIAQFKSYQQNQLSQQEQTIRSLVGVNMIWSTDSFISTEDIEVDKIFKDLKKSVTTGRNSKLLRGFMRNLA